jgi:hypothetical protein
MTIRIALASLALLFAPGDDRPKVRSLAEGYDAADWAGANAQLAKANRDLIDTAAAQLGKVKDLEKKVKDLEAELAQTRGYRDDAAGLLLGTRAPRDGEPYPVLWRCRAADGRLYEHTDRARLLARAAPRPGP